MRELGPASRAIVDSARGSDEPTHDDRARVRRAIDARLSADPALRRDRAPTHSESASGSLAAAGKAALALKVLAAVAAMGLAIAVVRSQRLARTDDPAGKLAVSSPSPSASPSSPTAELPPPSATPAQAVQIAPSVATASARPWGSSSKAASQGKTQRPVAQADPGGLEAEVALLGRGREAWRSGDAEQALALINEHARRYPDGALREEREAFRVALLCALGRTQEARAARDRFLVGFPDSAHAPGVTAACEDGSSPF
jgi:hypothetical protein